jgi:hypothetical protein
VQPDAPASCAAWRDDSGYTFTERDRSWVLLTEDDLVALADRSRPLGMTTAAYDYVVDSLKECLKVIDVLDADVRLQGSSAFLFSGAHKALPRSRSHLIQLMRERLQRIPKPFEVDEVEARIEELWPAGSLRPLRPYFDLFYRLRVDRDPSDIDVQISSGQLFGRAARLAHDLGVDPETLKVVNQHYSFLQTDVVDRIAPLLIYWADDCTDLLRRKVAVHVFERSGPPDVSKVTKATVSSHFRTTDWLILSSGGDL